MRPALVVLLCHERLRGTSAGSERLDRPRIERRTGPTSSSAVQNIDSHHIHRDGEWRPLGGGETVLRAEPDARARDGGLNVTGGTPTHADWID